jgi:pentatricopeptide repeat protein
MEHLSFSTQNTFLNLCCFHYYRLAMIHLILLLICCLHGSAHSLSINSGKSPRQLRQESLKVGHHPLLSLNMNLDALAQARAPERAQELYQRIAALHEEGYYAVSPDVVSFNSVLKAWQSDPFRALEFWEQEAAYLTPNVRSYNTFLLALAKAGLYEEAETMLRQMQANNSTIRPDRITYNTVLLSYFTSKDIEAASRASDLLQELIDSPDYKPDATSFNTVISAWALHETEYGATKANALLDQMKDHHLEPDVYTYTSVIHAWAICGAAEKAWDLLQTMNDTVAPNKVTYTVVLQALCKNRQPDAAQAVVDHMLEQGKSDPTVRPDVVTFSALLDGWADIARDKPIDTFANVQRILNQMDELPGVEPNARTYTSAFAALGRSRLWNAGPLGETILRQMKERGVEPNVIHYNVLLDAYAKSPHSNKVDRALHLWTDMKKTGIAPDTITYNSLLAAAANSFGQDAREKCLKVGLSTFSSLEEDSLCQATSLSYHYVFKILRKNMPRSNTRYMDIIKRAFDLCCQQGCLNNLILEQLLDKCLVSQEEQRLVLGNYWTENASLDDLPSEWARRAIKQKQRGKRRGQWQDNMNASSK